jgi:acyl dehydratase
MDAPAPHRFVAHVVEEADNKIHDDDVARRFGFTGALVPGVELFARLTTPLVQAWGEEWLSGGRVDVRFRRPVYDGEELLVEVGDDGRLTATGADGEVRCVGSAGPTADRPDLTAFAESPAGPAPVADPVVGPFGSVSEAVTVEQNEWYLDAVGEPLALYRDNAWAQPGMLIKAVHRLLTRNVALGPWIHTASDCRFLGVARLPALMTSHGRVTHVGRRGRNDEVRYDALVLADGAPVLHVRHTALYRLDVAGGAPERA